MLARQLSRSPEPINYDIIGDNLSNIEKKGGAMYRGPNWFTEEANNNIYKGIYR
jgi:hypothetical protein